MKMMERESLEYQQRQSRLVEKMRAGGVDAFLVTQNVDIYYLTGTMQAGFMIVPVEGEPVFYVRKSVERAKVEAACEVRELASFRSFGKQLTDDYPKLFATSGRPAVATEYDVLPVQMFERLQAALPNVQWHDGSVMFRELRMIKSEYELELMKESARVVDLAFERAVGELHAGMTDIELMVGIEQTLRLNGHAGVMRMRSYNSELITGMVASGADAAVPTYFDGPAGGRGLSAAAPQSSGFKRIDRNEPILIDIGCMINGYVIDQTRTVVIGELPDHLLRAYEVSEHILRETEKKLHPGTVCESLYYAALDLADEAGLADHFMGYGADQVRFLGHGIGMEIDEYPVLARGFTYSLEPGMVIAIEPKFTFPGEGVVGIENTYAVTANSYERLTMSREGLIRL